jgi:mannose-6-phosphate isomerase-like protein (cupin superfamily)
VYSKVNDSAAILEAHNAHGGDGTIRVNVLFPHESKLPVHISILELDPGVSEGSHSHEGDESLEEVYYFTKGEGVMWIEGRDVPVKAGEAVLAPPGVDHGLRNTGKGPMKVVLIWGKPED